MFRKKNKFKNIVLLFFIFILNSCEKNQNIVPYVYVNQYINISLPTYSNLNSIGGWVYISGGSKGIIIYRQSYDQFSTYDRQCTYNSDQGCGKVTLDSTNTHLECDCDASQYQLFDGLVIQGPANYSLKNYQSSFNVSSNQLHIYN
tara:strand:- start:884 stop:1321 length:438 start_codon:yes stop_codon:yes gene_type:complete